MRTSYMYYASIIFRPLYNINKKSEKIMNTAEDRSLFGLHVHSCTRLLRPYNHPPPLHLSSHTRALLVSQYRRSGGFIKEEYCS